jgi:hypothetical protein
MLRNAMSDPPFDRCTTSYCGSGRLFNRLVA